VGCLPWFGLVVTQTALLVSSEQVLESEFGKDIKRNWHAVDRSFRQTLILAGYTPH
jgi:hypothetical protein